MADTLSDLFPLPVTWIDGEQPTARKLNYFSEQIDQAFAMLARLIGDFDGSSSGDPTYITNFIRSLGSMGLVSPWLPRGIGQVELNAPEVEETLLSPEGKKEFRLTFLPNESNGEKPITTTLAGWTKVDQGTYPGENLTGIEQWLLEGRRGITSSPLPASVTITYPIHSNSFDDLESGGPITGANVIPNMYEIADSRRVDPNPPYKITDLCAYSEAGGEMFISFPYILRLQDIDNPFRTSQAFILDLTPDNMYGNGAEDNPSLIKWKDDTAPRYTTPVYIEEKADIDGLLPSGLVALYIDDGATIHRLVNENSDEQILFYIVDGDPSSLRIELPPTYTLPHEADIDLINKYIVVFAGQSITEAILGTTAAVRTHQHDGEDSSAPVSIYSMKDRFNPETHTESAREHNPFPQYMLRGGYLEGFFSPLDPLNKNNAITGNILFARSDIDETDQEQSPESLAVSSFGIRWGDLNMGPYLYFSVEDLTYGLGDMGADGKLTLTTMPLRVVEGLFIGGAEQTWLQTDSDTGILKIGSEDSSATSGSILQVGHLVSSDSNYWFGGYGLVANGRLLLSYDSEAEAGTFYLKVLEATDSATLEVGHLYNVRDINSDDVTVADDLLARRIYPTNGDHQYKFISASSIIGSPLPVIGLEPTLGLYATSDGITRLHISEQTLGLMDHNVESISIFRLRIKIANTVTAAAFPDIRVWESQPVMQSAGSFMPVWHSVSSPALKEYLALPIALHRYGLIEIVQGLTSFKQWDTLALDPDNSLSTDNLDGGFVSSPSLDLHRGASLIIEIDGDGDPIEFYGAEIEYRRNYE